VQGQPKASMHDFYLVAVGCSRKPVCRQAWTIFLMCSSPFGLSFRNDTDASVALVVSTISLG
jgi:hypothetical protein